MDILLSLLLQLQHAQVSLSQMQSARATRSELRISHPSAVPTVKPVQSAPAPVTSSAQPVQRASVSSDFASQVEQYVFSDTNAARAQNGLAPLMQDGAAAAVARAHSQDMLINNYFEHTNLQGCNPGCRLTNAGYVWRSYGENIHWMSGYELSAADTAQKIVNDWMNSPGHRANILGSFTYTGVGVAVSGSKIYSTGDYTTK